MGCRHRMNLEPQWTYILTGTLGDIDTMASDSGPVVVIVIQIPMKTNSGNAWKVSWFLGKWGFWTIQFPGVLDSLLEVDVSSEWLNMSEDAPSASSVELSQVDAPRCSARAMSFQLPEAPKFNSEFTTVTDSERCDRGFSWAWRGQCTQEGQSTSCLYAFSKKLFFQTLTNLANSWKEGSPLSTVQASKALPPLPFLHMNVFTHAGVKACPWSCCSTPVKNDSTGWQVPLWICNRVVELQYLPRGAAGSPGEAWTGCASWQAVHCLCLCPCCHTVCLCDDTTPAPPCGLGWIHQSCWPGGSGGELMPKSSC